MYQVSYTKVRLWVQCRMAFNLKYVEGLKKKIKPRPLQFGIIMHEMLEAEANNIDPLSILDKWDPEELNTFRREKEIYGEIIKDSRHIMSEYLNYYKDDSLSYIPWNKQRAEHWFEVDLTSEIRGVMKVDAFAKTPNKLRWLMENKTAKKIPDEDARWKDLQTSVYLRMLEMQGLEPFDGVLWNYLRSKSPTTPAINQDGRVSAAQIDTLPITVREFLKDNDIKLRMDSKAKIVLRNSQSNVRTYFKRVFSPVNKTVVNSLFSDFVSYANEAKDLHRTSKQRNIGMHCSWCDFELVCRAELTGGDPEAVKERQYVNKNQDKKEALKFKKQNETKLRKIKKKEALKEKTKAIIRRRAKSKKRK